MSDLTDALLAAEGDHQAFERLYRKHLSRIYSLCTRLTGSSTKGVGLTEEVFVSAWEKLPQWRAERPFGPWLHRLAAELGLSGLDVDGRAGEPITHGERPDLSQAIDRLPPDARSILVLHDVEGYTTAEIAEIFGTTVGVSRARLHRARVLLRKVLGQ